MFTIYRNPSVFHSKGLVMVSLKALVLSLLFIVNTAPAVGANKEFSVDTTQGYMPLALTFNASNIKSAKKYHWNLGDGETIVTSNPILNYTYRTAGTFSASLKYAVNASDKEAKNLKDGGSVQIKVQQQTDPNPNVAPVANLSCSINNLVVFNNKLSSL